MNKKDFILGTFIRSFLTLMALTFTGGISIGMIWISTNGESRIIFSKILNEFFQLKSLIWVLVLIFGISAIFESRSSQNTREKKE